MKAPPFSLRLKLDRIGIALSGLCAVHCLASIAMVALVGIGGLWGGHWLLSPTIHQVGLALAVAVGAVTVGVGVWRHGRMLPLAIGGAGVCVMALALFAPHGIGEAALTIAGVAAVATAHLLNLRFHAL